MLAAQKLNARKDQAIHGSVSSGEFWYFCRLQNDVLTRDPRSFSVTELDKLFAALRYVFEEAKKESAPTQPEAKNG
jgi:hypothetical protein